MPRKMLALSALALALLAARPASAGVDYVALGDSVTRGEGNLVYAPSDGNQGYVSLVDQGLAARNGGVAPTVYNFAIDGETAASFRGGAGRVPPVVGRTDPILAAENTNYATTPLQSQDSKFQALVASERAAGNTIGTVSITLGFNDLATLVGQPASAVGTTLAAYQAGYASILSEIRSLAPGANVLVLGYYNPFPADPSSPAAPIFNTYGTLLNTIIRGLAAQYGETFVDTAPPFVGNEATYTYIAQQPAGTNSLPVGPYQGILPVGNVHPTLAGYQSIANSVLAAQAAVPEPGSATLLALGLAALGFAGRRRIAAARAA